MRSWFSHPLALHLFWLLPALSVLGVFAWRRRQRAFAQLGPLTAARTLTAVAGSASARTRAVRAVCWLLGLAALVLAVGGPRWGRSDELALAPGRDLVAVLDLSRSMLARDVLPSRVARARQALLDLSAAVERRGGHRLALVVFAARARVVCPLTHDYEHFRAAVVGQDPAHPHPEIRPVKESDLSGTRLGAALLRAVETHDPRFEGYQDILLLSDGDDPARDAEWRAGAAAARERGIPVHVVGIGDPEKASPVPGRGEGPLRHEGKVVQSRLEEGPLQEIARGTRGTWTPARTQDLRLGELFYEAIEPAALREAGEDAVTIYQPRYAWFFAAALVLLILEMTMGWTWSTARTAARKPPATNRALTRPARQAEVALVLLPLVGCLVGAASSLDWEAALHQAVEAFARHDYETSLRLCEQAEERTTDPGLVAFNKAAALYQLGLAEQDPQRSRMLFQEAERHYRFCLEDAAGPRRARALFDLGNALLQQGRDSDTRLLERAIATYELALREPAATSLLDDIRWNLELAKTLWLRAQAKQANHGQEPPERDPSSPTGKSNRSPGLPDAGATQDLRGKVRPGQADSGDPAQGHATTTQPPPPGKGEIPPLPDDENLVPLSPEDLAAHLRRAAERIERERAEFYQRVAQPPSGKVRDW